MSRRREVEREINKLLEAEETMWNQRSRVTWLKKGDRNTRFFHEKAKSRGRNNTIRGLFDESNVWQSDSDNIGSMFCNYFNGLFTQTGGQDMVRRPDPMVRRPDPMVKLTPGACRS